MIDGIRILALDSAIRAVCPNIDGVSVGDWNDKETWRVDFMTSATDEQKSAAQEIIKQY